MKPLLASLALLSLVGCAHTPYADSVSVNLAGQVPYRIINIDHIIGYLVDPRTESCLLVYAYASVAQVSCAKLKKNVPEAARYITWDVGGEDAPAPAAPSQSAPPPSSH